MLDVDEAVRHGEVFCEAHEAVAAVDAVAQELRQRQHHVRRALGFELDHVLDVFERVEEEVRLELAFEAADVGDGRDAGGLFPHGAGPRLAFAPRAPPEQRQKDQRDEEEASHAHRIAHEEVRHGQHRRDAPARRERRARHVALLVQGGGQAALRRAERRGKLARRAPFRFKVAAARREHDVVVLVRHNDVKIRREELLREEAARQQEEHHAVRQPPPDGEVGRRNALAIDPFVEALRLGAVQA